MFTKKLVSLIAVSVIGGPLAAVFAVDTALVFNTTTPTNDLKGSLAARVQFAQSQIVPTRLSEGDNQPHLIGHRTCLLLVRPLKADRNSLVQVTARDGRGKTLGMVNLDPPAKRNAARGSEYHQQQTRP